MTSGTSSANFSKLDFNIWKGFSLVLADQEKAPGFIYDVILEAALPHFSVPLASGGQKARGERQLGAKNLEAE